MKKTIFYTLSLFFTFIQAGAQVNVDEKIFEKTNEKAFLHLNSNTFLAGENLLYSFYNIQKEKELSSVSKIGYVSLIDTEGNVVAKQKVHLENGRAYGEIFIPTSVETGTYGLIGYTKWMLNEPVSGVFETKVIIVNPFKAPPSRMVTQDSTYEESEFQNLVNTNENGSEKIQLEIEKEEFEEREKVELEIESELEGNFSLSVRKVDEFSKLENDLQIGNFSKVENNGLIATPEKNYLPELRGELLTGSLKPKNPQVNAKNKIVALSIPGEDFLYRVVETDDAGNFRFILDHKEKDKDAVVQVVGKNRENFEILIDSSFVDFSAFENKDSLRLSKSLADDIEQRSIALQIENAYYQQKKDSIIPAESIKAFYAPLATTYVLDEYTRFPTLAETIIEIVPEMYFTRENGNYQIHLRDQHDTNKDIYGETLILVDGLLIQDVNNLFAYPMDNVERIELVNDGYIYGPKLYDGVVNLITKNKDYNAVAETDYLVKTKLQRPAPEKLYLEPKYNGKNELENIPDYRYQLLWMPELNLEEGENSISFYTSDLTGIFEVVLEGISNTGELISLVKYFKVE